MRKITVLGLILAITAAAGCVSPKGATVSEKRASVLTMRDETLADLYARKPELKKRVEGAAGYGSFSNIGTNIIFTTTGSGYGIVVNNKTGEKTYMKMAELGLGLGLGIKDFRAVFVFHNEDVLNKFVNKGWKFGAEADVAAKSGEKGGAVGAAGVSGSAIEVYQLTKTGIALQASIVGTKYWRDKDLNAK